MRILVTGSKGLIGSALTANLKSLGATVVEYDSAGEKTLPHHGDILDKNHLEKQMKGCQGVIHLAAVSRVVFGEKNPELCWKTNVEGTQNVLDVSLKLPEKPWVIYASSREVYGQQARLPVSESDPLQPVNIYGKSKLHAEQACLRAREKGLQVGILRYSNVFGSVNDHHDRVIPAFCIAALAGKTLHVEGGGNLFDFTYIEDVVKGTLSMVSALLANQTKLPPIHLTTGQATSLDVAARYAISAGKETAKIAYATPRSYDVATFCGNPALAKQLLDWEATVPVQEGIKRLINQFRIQSSIIQ